MAHHFRHKNVGYMCNKKFIALQRRTRENLNRICPHTFVIKSHRNHKNWWTTNKKNSTIIKYVNRTEHLLSQYVYTYLLILNVRIEVHIWVLMTIIKFQFLKRQIKIKIMRGYNQCLHSVYIANAWFLCIATVKSLVILQCNIFLIIVQLHANLAIYVSK